uniref:Zgc:172079 n=1 Tax=Maylandia zebra TaxID=106582 RepID=A0A3P9BSI1_9CICH
MDFSTCSCKVTMSISNTTTCTNDSTNHFDIIHVCLYSFIFIVGLTLNVIALVFFFCQIKSRSPTVVYMTNLTVADFLLILTLPVRIYYHLGLEGIPLVLCDCLGLILKANMYGSILFLACICFDRCVAVSFPMSTRIQRARQKSWLICLGRENVSLNVTKHCFDNPPVYATQPAVVFSTLFLGFGLPLAIMLVCSWILVHTVQKSTVAQTNLLNSRTIRRMIATSLLIFLFSFSPYHATLVVLSLHREPITSRTCSGSIYSVPNCFSAVRINAANLSELKWIAPCIELHGINALAWLARQHVDAVQPHARGDPP